jgi:uncharacterized membrane protein YGL010W
MKTLTEWLDEYAVSHQNSTNKLIHWYCVPTIFFTVVGLLYSIPVGEDNTLTEGLIAKIILVAVIAYYFMLSKALSVGMLIFGVICLYVCHFIKIDLGFNLAITSLVVFVIAWIFQFWGHNIEGKKPSFLKDLQFLMIGPAWVMTFIYKKIGINLS